MVSMTDFPTLEDQVAKADACCSKMHEHLVSYFTWIGRGELANGRMRLGWSINYDSRTGKAVALPSFHLPILVDKTGSFMRVSYCPWCGSGDRPYKKGRGFPGFTAPEPVK